MSAEQTPEMTELEKAIQIVGPMIDDGASDEDMVIALIKSGMKFAKAGRLLAKAMEAKGQRLSSKDRYAAVSELLANWEFKPENWKDVESCVESLVAEIDATTEGQAMSCLKRYAKEHNLTLPEKPAQRLTNNFNDRFMEWALTHRNCTADELRQFIVDSNAKENQVDKYVNQFGFVLKFARAFAQ